jgi:hypothetical protein
MPEETTGVEYVTGFAYVVGAGVEYVVGAAYAFGVAYEEVTVAGYVVLLEVIGAEIDPLRIGAEIDPLRIGVAYGAAYDVVPQEIDFVTVGVEYVSGFVIAELEYVIGVGIEYVIGAGAAYDFVL